MNREILAPGPCCRGRPIGVELRPRRVTNAVRQTAIMHRAARVNVPHHRHHLLVDEAPAVLLGPGQRICPACWTALPDRPLPGPAPRPPAPPMPCSAQALEVIGQTGFDEAAQALRLRYAELLRARGAVAEAVAYYQALAGFRPRSRQG